MYRSISVSKLVTRICLTVVLSLTTFTMFGCSGTGESNSGFGLGPQSDAEKIVDSQSEGLVLDKSSNIGKGTLEECAVHNLGFVTLMNRMRCQAVQVVLDGELFSCIAPASGLDAIIPAGYHDLVFESCFTGAKLGEWSFYLSPCQSIEFSTSDDFCVEAMK